VVEGCQILVSNRYLSIVDDGSDITTFFHEALKSVPGITIFTFTDPILALEHFKTNISNYFLVFIAHLLSTYANDHFVRLAADSGRMFSHNNVVELASLR